MAERELRRLKRRDLLQMLLTQCEETERLQQEAAEWKAQLDTLTESYERLKAKLNIKDERLNEKDARIEELESEIGRMRASREIELEEAGSIAEAALRINGVFEAAQRAAEQYLMNVRRLAGSTQQDTAEEATPDKRQPASEDALAGQVQTAMQETDPERMRAAVGMTENRDPHETGWMAGIRKKQPRTRQVIPMNVGQIRGGTSGDIHGR